MDESFLERLIMTRPEIIDVWKQYMVLKGLFIARKLNGADILEVFKRVSEISGVDGWGKAGIDEAAKRHFRAAGGQSGQEPLVWLHPQVLLDCPATARYYLGVASIGQKIGGEEYPNLSRIAEHELRPDDKEVLTAHLNRPIRVTEPLVAEIFALNALITQLLAAGISPSMFGALAVSSIGATLDGAWKDRIGRLGVIKTLVQVGKAVADSIVAIEVKPSRLYVKPGVDARAFFASRYSERQLANRLDVLRVNPVDFLNNYEDQEGRVAALWLSNGFRVVAEYLRADVCILDATDTVVAAGEVKANTDPQNSWERWRIGQETLSQFKKKWPHAIRFYIGLMLHEGVVMGEATRVGIKQAYAGDVLNIAFNLHRIEENTYGAFVDFREWIREVCRLPKL